MTLKDNMDEYDLVVVGSGAGLNVLNVGLSMGLKCALIENTKIGGTCLTRGCIPSKILVYPADVIREAQHAKKIGLELNLKGYNWDLIAERMWSQIEEGEQMQKGLSQVDNLDLFMGTAEFTGDHEMRVKLMDSQELVGPFKAKRIVIASGGRTLVPPIEGIAEAGYITSESFFNGKFPKKPWKSLVIIGGGIIAAEFAHIFSAFGTEVTIVEMLPRLVSTEEPEVSELLEKTFRKHMNVYVKKKAVKVKKKHSKKVVILEDVDTGELMKVDGEEILIATGRRSNADLLKVDQAGIETDERGWIKTNEFLETNVDNIWCFGDANGLFQFRHKANSEAEVCTNNIFGEQKQAVDYSAVPWAIFTYPQIGHVGMTQQEAIDAGHKIFVAKNRYSSVAKGFAMGYEKGDELDGLVKLVVDQSYKILGAHVVGPHAAMLVQSFVYLMNSGYTCPPPKEEVEGTEVISKAARACPEGGSFLPIYRSMVIHPSLNEVAAWAIGNLRPVNIEMQQHHH
ncbi:MAG: dihydrolipoamide dehydrogenase [Promethearchaeota archaeon]|nr:MAG: dihydrolipoamide dehydrogenase [Candidatus Lokiarchaeota archaeon]